jgi:hypothetical protein
MYCFEPDAVELGWSMRRLGELYERRGRAGLHEGSNGGARPPKGSE